MDRVLTFDTAFGVIAWKHPEVAFAIRARVQAAPSERRADKIKEQAISIANIIAAAGEGGLV